MRFSESSLMIIILFIMSMLLLSGCGNSIDVTDLQEGDVVFIESQSSQSPYIKVGTMSKWTHCGVVVNTPQGLKVLEASKTVRLTPFAKFIGSAKDENWTVKRPKQKLARPISYSKYLGMPYDLEFKFENGKSDYRKITDTELCTQLDTLARNRYNKLSVYQLTDAQKQHIASEIYRSHHISSVQIKRCLAM